MRDVITDSRKTCLCIFTIPLVIVQLQLAPDKNSA